MVQSAGEPVKPGDNLFEIETDKVSMEVPSTTTGVLAEIRVPAGEVAPVGAVVAVIADGAGADGTSAGRDSAGAQDQPQRRQRPQAALRWRRQHRWRSQRATSRVRSNSIRSSRCARRSAISVRRGCRAASRSRRWRAGSPPRPGSISTRMRGSGPHGRIVARDIENAPRPSRAPLAALAEGPTRR